MEDEPKTGGKVIIGCALIIVIALFIIGTMVTEAQNALTMGG